jgi:membrane-bound lytic murein transglycosylase MltF
MISKIIPKPIVIVSSLLLLHSFAQGGLSQELDSGTEVGRVLMDRVHEKWTGDLHEIKEKRRGVRVLVSYCKTNFFVARGHPRGFEYELLREYERFLNRRVGRKGIKTHVVFVALPFDQLIPALLEGRGDIAAAGLTITPERGKLVAFTDPYLINIDEIVITSKMVKGLKTRKDLAGRKVHVVSGSSYVQHLRSLNRELTKEGLKPVHIVEADENLEAEDILEMVNAGILELTVVDRHIAELWSSVLKELILRKDIVINSGGKIGWAVRKESPQLLADLNEFVRENRQGTLLGNILLKRYYKNAKWIRNPLVVSERQKLEELKLLFQKYAKQYNFDWLKIAALAYQESGLDQSVKSPAGAVGIMQILPSTAAGRFVGIPDVHDVESNIHAGVKYLSFLRDRYFNDPEISPAAKLDFTFAAYNAGPAKVASLRRKAKNLNLDPNKWFFNVEHAAHRVIGQETVQYVANINKYFIAYKSIEKTLEQRSFKLKTITGSDERN